ncbi:MAG: MAPEG family protein [Deltaproteobacteria bacterium]|nr:MAPEG family protein [Deltaproteobacteria bacterium]
METAILCTVLLGLLLFGLGLAVSLTRGNTNTISGFNPDPTDWLYKMVRAHGNTAEFAPMVAVLLLFLGSRNPSTWVLWTMWIVTICRYLIVVGILASPTLAKAHPLRFIGALGTYVGGAVLCVAAYLSM